VNPDETSKYGTKRFSARGRNGSPSRCDKRGANHGGKRRHPEQAKPVTEKYEIVHQKSPLFYPQYERKAL
jgi:hypothetical protein